jgi:hypothetical protein
MMRLRPILLAVSITLPVAAAAAPAQDSRRAGSESNCARTHSYVADQSGAYRGQRLVPKKLTELPPAVGYMAVYRHIGGCEAPLTMVEYRNPKRR